MKKKCIFIIAVLLCGFIAGASGQDFAVRASTLEVHEDYDSSFEAMPSEQIIQFLEGFDIDLSASKAKVAAQLDKLLNCDSCDDDRWENAKDELHFYINRVLFAAMAEGNVPVYMTLGTSRWILVPGEA